MILAPDGQAFIGRTLPTSPVKVGKGNHGKLAAFTQLYINFEHEKRWSLNLELELSCLPRCMKKCFMMEPKQKATWAEIDVGALVTPDFVKACIRFVSSTKTKTLLEICCRNFHTTYFFNISP